MSRLQKIVAQIAMALGVFPAGISAPASAGEFYGKDGIAIAGFDPVAYFRENKAVQGNAGFTFAYRESVFRFASAANRDAFAGDPLRYAPQYGGYCAYGTAGGYKAVADPTVFTIIDGKLYLNFNKKVQQMWTVDAPGFISRADDRWPAVAKTTKVLE